VPHGIPQKIQMLSWSMSTKIQNPKIGQRTFLEKTIKNTIKPEAWVPTIYIAEI